MKDVKIVQEVLEESKVYNQQAQRKHSSFTNLNALLQQCPSEHMKEWITNKIKMYRL